MAQRLFLGGQITKTIVANLGSKEIQKEDTPVSFGNAFEDEWEEVEEYVLSVFKKTQRMNCQLFLPKYHQSQLRMIRNLQLLF